MIETRTTCRMQTGVFGDLFSFIYLLTLSCLIVSSLPLVLGLSSIRLFSRIDDFLINSFSPHMSEKGQANKKLR